MNRSACFARRRFRTKATPSSRPLRGTFDPAYLNYTLGKLMIRKLRDDWYAARGGRGPGSSFTTNSCSYGGPPIPLIRRAMMGPATKARCSNLPLLWKSGESLAPCHGADGAGNHPLPLGEV